MTETAAERLERHKAEWLAGWRDADDAELARTRTAGLVPGQMRPWEGHARMAHARHGAGVALDERDRAALVAFPARPPMLPGTPPGPVVDLLAIAIAPSQECDSSAVAPWLPPPGPGPAGLAHVPDATGTETAAAEAQRDHAGALRIRVLAAFLDAGDEGRTDYENAVALGTARVHVPGSRRGELVDRYRWRITDTGRRRPTDTGSPATVWALHPDHRDAARAALEAAGYTPNRQE